MSKSNRRRQRPGFQPSGPRPTGAPLPKPTTPDPTATPSASAARAGTPPATPRSTGTPPGGTRPVATSRPTNVRHGRRERQRIAYQPSFLERYRTLLVLVAALAGVALLSVFVFVSAAQPAYACSTIFTPAPTASPLPGATQVLGYVQPDMGNTHAAVGDKVTYTYCAPASGTHYNAAGRGPIAARVYAPSDTVIPEGWIHNLEHGALVILYKGTSPGATADGQAQFKTFYDSFPNSPICGLPRGALGPIIARFDDMATPFEAIVWGRVLPLQTFDQTQVMAFFTQWGERTNPEKQCAVPSGLPPASSFVPDNSDAPSAVPSTTPVPSTTAAPSVAAPTSSAAPSAS